MGKIARLYKVSTVAVLKWVRAAALEAKPMKLVEEEKRGRREEGGKGGKGKKKREGGGEKGRGGGDLSVVRTR